MSRDTALAQTRAWLRQSGLRPRKGLGQYFLVEPGVLSRIIEAADLVPQDTVVEVGPGLGLLTRELVARSGRVIAVEVDRSLALALPQLLGHPPNLTVLQADILSLDAAHLTCSASYKVVANLPFYIAAPAIRLFLESQAKPERMVVMVQKEVAQRILAQPGQMSLISVAIQLYARPRLIGYVSARCFYPVPKVDSAVVCLEVYPKLTLDVDAQGLFRVVRGGFSAPRKQLRNTLAQGLNIPPEQTAALLAEAGIAPQRRPQSLSLEEWGGLYQVFATHMPSVFHAPIESSSQA